MTSKPSHFSAVLLALFVTFLWSTSWVLIKIGLEDIPSLTFAGLRYMIAFLILLPFSLRAGLISKLKQISGREWLKLIVLGLLYYTITQGTQYVSLQYLPAVTVSLLLSFTGVLVAFLGMGLLQERPTSWQWAGMVLYVGGVLIFFWPVNFPAAQWFGLGVAVAGVLANALSAVIGRQVNRAGKLDTLTITTVTMGIGAVPLFASGALMQGLPVLRIESWLIIVWLALVNSALAFTLWNRSLRTLTALEASLINNTMLYQIALLAWLFLDEPLSGKELVGMLVAAAGILAVQLARAKTDSVNAKAKPVTGVQPE